MPIHDLHCQDCGEVWEELILPSSEEPKCPTCGSKKHTKLLGACSFRLYGSGFTKRTHRDTGDWGG